MFQVIKTNYSVSLHRLVKDVAQPVCAALQLFILYGCSAEVSFIESFPNIFSAAQTSVGIGGI